MWPTHPTRVMVWWPGFAWRIKKYLSLCLSALLLAFLVLSQTDDSPELPQFTQPSAENSNLELNLILDRKHRRVGEVVDDRKGDPPFGTAEPGVTYPSCGKPPLTEWGSDLEYVMQRLQTANLETKPFSYHSLICDAWPPRLYEDMIAHWPPLEKLQHGNETCKKDKFCGKKIVERGACKKQFNIQHFFQRSSKDYVKVWSMISQAQKTWYRVKKVLEAPELQKLLWKKFDVLGERNETVVRLFAQYPHAKKRLKVHSDSPYTAATILFNMPSHESSDTWRYGTCFHTAVSEVRHKDTGRIVSSKIGDRGAPCTHRHRYLPNSAIVWRTVPSVVGGEASDRHDWFDKWNKGGRTGADEFPGRNATHPSWHSEPLLKWDKKCSFVQRRLLVLTYTNKLQNEWEPRTQ
mmetsp:Transcript_6730/g.22423  ORF Transcript_6730/g.22423 Transcript_6730/m.22423 type:complete len:406 (+) Transcript_6730:218-1435(+)